MKNKNTNGSYTPVKAASRKMNSSRSPQGTSFSATVMPKKKRASTTIEKMSKGKGAKTADVKAKQKKTLSPKVPKTVKPPRVSTKKQLESVAPVAQKAGKTSKKMPVKVLFLGGVNEIGKNMTAIEYGNDIIIIDAGMTFPSEEMPGIDSVVPDSAYLTQNKEKIKGIFITHGHEDHIGGLSYLLNQINPMTPIYGTRLTLMLADNKLQENHLQNTVQRVVQSGDTIKAGAFEIEFINVNHSIAGACALAIRTPRGLIYHSGDFKIDLTPVTGEAIDLKRIAELGKEGVLLYMAESTNIERIGYTMSETVVGTTLDHLFSENVNRRIIIATFASNVHRLQQIIDLAVKYRRKVALSGRSMFKVTEAAIKIGELKIPEGVLVDIEQTRNLFDGELVIVSTGSQGEPMSALTRMAMGEFNKVTVGPNDTIIISATPIPGNEKMVYRVINNLYQKGARVVYESLEKIHVSGHACQEEHKILHNLLKPKFFIPVHGEYRHLKRHADLAQSLGMPPQNILIAEIGNCVELTETTMKLGENIPAGTMLIDGLGVEDFGSSELVKERLRMSTEGIVVVSLAVTGGYVINDPVIETRGFVTAKCTAEEISAVVKRAVDQYDYENGDKEELSSSVRKSLRNYLYKKTKQSPFIIVTVMDV